MASIFDALKFLQPQGLSDYSQGQQDNANKIGLLNAAAVLANMSAPQSGFKSTPMQLVTGGLLGYQQGAQNGLEQFYKNKENETKAIGNDVENIYNRDNLDWFKNNPQKPAPTFGDFYRTDNPLSVRNNNPGNLRGKDGNFRQFSSPEEGANAMASDLTGKITGKSPIMQQRYGANYTPTLENVISTWAPPTENDTGNYINFVAQQTGIDPKKPLTEADIPKVQAAMTQMEGGNKASSYFGGQSAPNSNSAMAKKYYDLAERQMRAGKPGADTLFALAAKYDPNIAKDNSNVPATLQVAEALKKARETGDTQLVKDIMLAGKMNAGFPLEAVGDAGQPTQQVSGDEYLKTLDPNVANQVKALAEGRMAFPGAFALKSPYWQQMLQAVSQYDPNFDAVNYNARAKTRNDFTSGKMAGNIRALNTAMAHASSLNDAYANLNNGAFPWLNAAENAVGTALGNSRIQKGTSDVETRAHALAGELAKVFRDTGMSQTEIDKWNKQLTTSASPEQYKAVLSSVMELMDGRLNAIGESYNQGMGTTKDPIELLSPEGQKAYKKLKGMDGTSEDGDIKQVSSPEEARNLPSGTKFMDPNGVVRVKH